MGVLLLDSINQPADLKQLNEKQVEQLCEEIRSFLLKTSLKPVDIWRRTLVW